MSYLRSRETVLRPSGLCTNGSGAYLLPSYLGEETETTKASSNKTTEKQTTGPRKPFTAHLTLTIAHGLGKRIEL